MTNKQRKSLEDLNLMDRFLFSAAMDDPQFVQDVLAIILGEDSASVRLQRIHKHITKLRSSEEMRVKYMREWEEKAYAKAEGVAEGEAKERLLIAKQMKLDGMPIEQIMKYTKLTASEIEELE